MKGVISQRQGREEPQKVGRVPRVEGALRKEQASPEEHPLALPWPQNHKGVSPSAIWWLSQFQQKSVPAECWVHCRRCGEEFIRDLDFNLGTENWMQV